MRQGDDYLKLSEAEEYVCEHTEDYIGSEFILEEDDDYIIYLEQPGYIIPDLDIVCYEGYWFDKEQDQADFCLTAVYENDEYQYWEQDGVLVTLHNYLRMTDKDVDVNSLECEINQNYDRIHSIYM